jgi:hypothetical protein
MIIPNKRKTLTDLMSIKIIFKFLPIKSSFPLGFASANIQANHKAMVAMRTANTASSFITPDPYFSRNRNMKLSITETTEKSK